MSTFNVGDRVRTLSSIYSREGETGHVVTPCSPTPCPYVHVTFDDGDTNGFPFLPTEIELVESAAPTFKVGDRVELAGVQGEVTYVSPYSDDAYITWSGGASDCIDRDSPLLKQLKKIEPPKEEQVFITGAWYRHGFAPNTLYYLGLDGFKGLYTHSGDLVLLPGCLPESEDLDYLTEVDSPL